jgi:hypothetical protein
MKRTKLFLLLISMLFAIAATASCGGGGGDGGGGGWPSGGGGPTSVNLPKTGQTTCYDAAGAVVACAGTGQDGDLQKGVAWPSPRFTDNGNGTVKDNLTGLIWLKDANCFSRRTWAQALSDANSLANGSCGLTDGSSAGNWRLPNRKELRSLINYSQANSAAWLNLPAQGFSNVQADYYWSSSTYAFNTTYAWVVGMYDGSVGGNFKTFTYYVWPVRAGQ